MKKIHYQNVGYPRTGTTWLWDSLITHPEIFKSDNLLKRIKTRSKINQFSFKENHWQEQNHNLLLVDFSDYIKIYEEYDISLNFRPYTFRLTTDHIKKISNYTTHVSMTLRNPYELFDSNYNLFIHKLNYTNLDHKPYSRFSLMDDEWSNFKIANGLSDGSDPNTFIDFWIYYFDFFNTIKKWMKFSNSFRVFFYDDLKNNYINFYDQVCNFIGVPFNQPLHTLINTREQMVTTKSLSNSSKLFNLPFTSNHITVINEEIDKLSELLERDLSHWKKNIK
jgi:hypothetical protein